MGFDPITAAQEHADPLAPGAMPDYDIEDDVRDAISEAAGSMLGADPQGERRRAYVRFVISQPRSAELTSLVQDVAERHQPLLDEIIGAAGARQRPVRDRDRLVVAEGLLATAAANDAFGDGYRTEIAPGVTLGAHAGKLRDAAVQVALGLPAPGLDR